MVVLRTRLRCRRLPREERIAPTERAHTALVDVAAGGLITPRVRYFQVPQKSPQMKNMPAHLVSYETDDIPTQGA